MEDVEGEMSEAIERTIAFIKAVHEGQTDKSGRSYWMHPVSVMQRLEDASEDAKLVALLHDVLEDTATTRDDLLALGYSREVVAAVELLSRPAGIAYLDWIRSIKASGNDIAIRVKIADNEDNMDPARIAALPVEMRSIVHRYAKSLRILRA